MELVLNDLSSQFPAENQYQARKVMKSFLKVYQVAKSTAGTNRLILDRDYNYISLAKGYCIEQWRNDHEVEEEVKRVFRSLIQRSATYDSFPIEDAAEFEVDLCKRPSAGCLLAYLRSGCCLSFPGHEEWDIPFIKGSYRFMNEETDQIDSCEASVPNIASEETASVFSQIFSEQIKREKRSSFHSGKDILDCAPKKFPNLIFCKTASDQLMAEGRHNNVNQIARRLIELQEYFETAIGAFDAQQLNHCTPESKATLDQYKLEHTFLLPSGREELFSWHLRFTGEYGDGRIFFYPDMTSKNATSDILAISFPQRCTIKELHIYHCASNGYINSQQ